MARYTFGQMPNWAARKKALHDAIVKQSAQTLMEESSRTATGRDRGGTLKPGRVPRADGFLAASLVSSRGGATDRGAGSFVGIIAGAKAGDTLMFGWTAVYARVQHYKHGWMWRDIGAKNWGSIVKRTVTRVRRLYE